MGENAPRCANGRLFPTEKGFRQTRKRANLKNTSLFITISIVPAMAASLAATRWQTVPGKETVYAHTHGAVLCTRRRCTN